MLSKLLCSLKSKPRAFRRASDPTILPESPETRGYLLQHATVLGLASLCAALPALAQDEIHLKLSHRLPATHHAWTEAGKVFVDAVNKASDGKVTFEVYPAAQLGKDNFTLLRSGLIDVAMFIPAYESDKLPMSSVIELPGMYSTVCEGTNKYWQLAKSGGVLGEGDFKKQGLHVLFVTVTPPNAILTKSRAIPDLEALAGLKIRANGASMTQAIHALGAVPIQMSASEAYEGLSRGTIDGALYPYYGLYNFSLQEQLNYSVDRINLGGSTMAFAISNKTWHSLPQRTQDIITQAALSTQNQFCEWSDRKEALVKERIQRELGHTVTSLTPDEQARWKARLSNVANDWAARMDAADLNGSSTLNALLRLSEKAK